MSLFFMDKIFQIKEATLTGSISQYSWNGDPNFGRNEGLTWSIEIETVALDIENDGFKESLVFCFDGFKLDVNTWMDIAEQRVVWDLNDHLEDTTQATIYRYNHHNITELALTFGRRHGAFFELQWVGLCSSGDFIEPHDEDAPFSINTQARFESIDIHTGRASPAQVRKRLAEHISLDGLQQLTSSTAGSNMRFGPTHKPGGI